MEVAASSQAGNHMLRQLLAMSVLDRCRPDAFHSSRRRRETSMRHRARVIASTLKKAS
ncbi:hypothetical protein LP419_17085 [Massilia sp. H-1]|nr:hypothetical protein LP419_17085 [Massilia sp. H-1]